MVAGGQEIPQSVELAGSQEGRPREAHERVLVLDANSLDASDEDGAGAQRSAHTRPGQIAADGGE